MRLLPASSFTAAQKAAGVILLSILLEKVGNHNFNPTTVISSRCSEFCW
jgi:hypothetical protein